MGKPKKAIIYESHDVEKVEALRKKYINSNKKNQPSFLIADFDGDDVSVREAYDSDDDYKVPFWKTWDKLQTFTAIMFIVGVMFTSFAFFEPIYTIFGADYSTVLRRVYGVLAVISFALCMFLMSVKIVPPNKPDDLGFWEWINESDKLDILATLFSAILVGVLYVLYHVNDYPERQVAIGILAIIEIRLAVKVIVTTLDNRKGDVDDDFSYKFFLAQHLILMIELFFIIPIFMGVEILSLSLPYLNSLSIQFNLCMILTSISGALGIAQVKRDLEEDDLDVDRTIFARYLIMILLPLLGLVMFPLTGSYLEASTMSGSITPAAIGQFNFFNTVYVAIVGSEYTQFTMVIIVISSLVVISGKARGQSGSSLMVIGAIGIAGIPMLITVMAFIGQIPAPTSPVDFYELFGPGFAELVFAICYTSVIALALSLVGVFYEMAPSVAFGEMD